MSGSIFNTSWGFMSVLAMSYGTVMFMQYYAEAKSIASAKLLISQTLEDSMRSKGELEE